MIYGLAYSYTAAATMVSVVTSCHYLLWYSERNCSNSYCRNNRCKRQS